VVNQKIIASSHQEITIDEFKQLMESTNEDVAILDMRNDYEYQL
jgi:predicted sulfurtransferase